MKTRNESKENKQASKQERKKKENVLVRQEKQTRK